MPDDKPCEKPELPRDVLVLGAGLAGCCTAREFAERGWQVTLLDAGECAASAASGNTAALLRPHVTRDVTLASRFFCDGFDAGRARLLQLLDAGEMIEHRLEGLLQLLNEAQSYAADQRYERLDVKAASFRAGLGVKASALFFPRAGWLNPKQLCCSLLRHRNITFCPQTPIDQLVLRSAANSDKDRNLSSCLPARWKLIGAGNTEYQSNHVVLACGTGINKFEQTNALPVTPVRGQITFVEFRNQKKPRIPVCGASYVIPAPTCCHVGATFKRGESSAGLQADEHQLNVQGLHRLFTEADSQMAIDGGWSGIRSSTPDRLPVVGPVPQFSHYPMLYAELHHGRAPVLYPKAEYLPGLYVNGGYGSRGVSCASLCARLLVDHVVGYQQHPYLELLHPARFLIRRLRRAPTAGK